MSSFQKFSYVTLLTSENYLPGAIVLASSLKSTGSSHSLVVMVPQDTLSPHALHLLTSHFDRIIYIPILRSQDKHNLILLGRTELDITLTKLHVWNPDLLPFDKICFLDADTLVIKNIDRVFDFVGQSHHADPDDGKNRPPKAIFAAAPDIGWPDCFNSGVFVTTPNQQIYENILAFARSKGSFDGGDQGLLNAFFDSWSGHKQSDDYPAARLPFGFNVTPSTSYSYLPAYVHYFNDIHVIHFIGKNKPWKRTRSHDGSVISDNNESVQTMELIRLWWFTFDNEGLAQKGLDDRKLSPPPPVYHAPYPTTTPSPEYTTPEQDRQCYHDHQDNHEQHQVHMVEEKPVNTRHQRPTQPPSDPKPPHAQYDFSFAKAPGLLPPTPPPVPPVSATTGMTIIPKPEPKQPSFNPTAEPISQAPSDFGQYKVDWNAKEFPLQINTNTTWSDAASVHNDASPTSKTTPKLDVLNDLELQLREFSIDPEAQAQQLRNIKKDQEIEKKRQLDIKLMQELTNIMQSSPIEEDRHRRADMTTLKGVQPKKSKSSILRKWLRIDKKSTGDSGFAWGLSGGTGKYQNLFSKENKDKWFKSDESTSEIPAEDQENVASNTNNIAQAQEQLTVASVIINADAKGLESTRNKIVSLEIKTQPTQVTMDKIVVDDDTPDLYASPSRVVISDSVVESTCNELLMAPPSERTPRKKEEILEQSSFLGLITEKQQPQKGGASISSLYSEGNVERPDWKQEQETTRQLDQIESRYMDKSLTGTFSHESTKTSLEMKSSSSIVNNSSEVDKKKKKKKSRSSLESQESRKSIEQPPSVNRPAVTSSTENTTQQLSVSHPALDTVEKGSSEEVGDEFSPSDSLRGNKPRRRRSLSKTRPGKEGTSISSNSAQTKAVSDGNVAEVAISTNTKASSPARSPSPPVIIKRKSIEIKTTTIGSNETTNKSLNVTIKKSKNKKNNKSKKK